MNRTDEGWELTLPDGATEKYRADGRLTGRADGAGRSVLLSYSPSGILESVVDDQGRRLSFAYNQAKLVEKVVISTGSETKFEYSGGLLSAVIHADGNRIVYKYKESGYANQNAGAGALTGVIDELGNRFSSTWYDAKGKAYKTDLANGVSAFEVSYTRENDKLVSTTVFPSGASRRAVARISGGALESSSFVDTCDGCLPKSSTYALMQGFLSSKSVSGVVTEFERELVDGPVDGIALGAVWIDRKTEASNRPEARTTEVWRRRDTNQIVKRVSSARTQTWLYNARGQVTQETTQTPAGETRTTTYTYCEAVDAQVGCPVLGLLLSTDGPMPGTDDTVRYTYYPEDAPGCATSDAACTHRKGDLWKTIQPLGQVTEVLAYDGAGRPHMVMDANGVVTEYQYTPRGWMASATVRGDDDASGTEDRITTMEYLPTGQLSKVTAPDGTVVTYTYDAAHRLTAIGDGAGNRIEYTLDAAGNRVQEEYKGASGEVKRTLSRVYNRLSQLVTSADGLANPTDFTYDAEGNVNSVIDALGHVSRREHDAFGRLTRQVDDEGGIAATVAMAYDSDDNQTQVIDPKQLPTTYAYNGFGDLLQQVSPDTGATTFTVDAAGNRTTRTDARGVTATYQYDVLGRVTHISYPDPTLDVAYTYDIAPAVCAANEQFSRGRVGTVIHAGGSTQYCHDRFGQLTRKVQTVNGVATTVRYGYTAGGRLATLTYPDGTVADYLRDSLGRISEVGVARPGQARQVVVTNVTYAPFGPATGWTYGNGRTLQRPVDQDYRTIAVHGPAPGGLSVGYGYDAVGGITELTNGDGTEVLAQYSYDALGRLTQTKDGATGTPIETYSYDATGNRTELITNAGTQVYSYPANSHRLADLNGEARDYDEAGNVLSIAGRNLEYGDSGRMSSAKQGGVALESYFYNHKGERVERTQAANEAIYTVYDEAGHWLGDYNSVAHSSQQAIWLDDFPVGLIGDVSEAVPALVHIQPDHLATPRAVIDPARDVTIWEWNSKGEAFGGQQPSNDPDRDGTEYQLWLRLPGQQASDATGLFYNYQREYEGATGRYTQSDPIGLDGGWSTYSYVGASPINFSDPYGLVKKQECIALAEIAGAYCGTVGGAYLGGSAGALGGGAACSPTGPGALACAGAGGLSGAAAGGVLGGLVGQKAGRMAGEAMCPDDDDPCDKKLDSATLKRAGIDGHGTKHDWLGTNKNISKYDLCGCKDGRVVVKPRGCRGPIVVETTYRWK
ncbi:RHS repeat-associated core domain-containing protein [Stenotrophomonas oahuensis]|uniref:RHS repeat protein n=1 Tax=Stenotrophomonas oahuensis TaxID=3003271 RepID=A0ABY9YRL0_9GAMM|nr:RHS repeat-associated core domain-containing protein [Stenotrophomonas sp. A5586]WNH53220.1 RHS repeat protein [Stenotrophomonas sp. A5586]